MPMTQDEVFEKVRETLVEALSVDEGEVTPQATLIGDLGAESIDLLDISFRLEKAFDIKIPQGGLFPDNILNNPQYVQNNRVTPAGLAELKASTPHVDYSQFEKDPDITKMLELFKVQTIVSYVLGRLGG